MISPNDPDLGSDAPVASMRGLTLWTRCGDATFSGDRRTPNPRNTHET